MVKRSYNLPDNEPDAKTFDVPSEKEHLFQVTDVFTQNDEMGEKLNLDENTVYAKLEVVGTDEEGRTLLQRLSLDDKYKGFFATRLFLKAIGEPHKGAIEIDSDRWIGRQFYATVKHDGKYANIDLYNFDKKVEQPFIAGSGKAIEPKDIQWEN